MSNDAPYLPGVLREIADEIDVDTALKLARARGGRSVYVPKKPEPNSELSLIVGHAEARAISALIGYGDLRVPAGPARGQAGRRERVEAMLRQGFSHAQIADRVDVAQRTVERIARKLANDTQLQLPI